MRSLLHQTLGSGRGEAEMVIQTSVVVSSRKERRPSLIPTAFAEQPATLTAPQPGERPACPWMSYSTLTIGAQESADADETDATSSQAVQADTPALDATEREAPETQIVGTPIISIEGEEQDSISASEVHPIYPLPLPCTY